MSHRGEVQVKIDDGGVASQMSKSDEKLKPPRLNASGPSPRDEGRLSPRKSQTLTPRKHADETREKSSTTPRKGAAPPEALKKDTKSKSGFLASFFGDAQPSSPAAPDRAEASPNPKSGKRRPGSTSMTSDQLISIRDAVVREDAAVGRSSSSGVASPDVAKDSPRGKSIGFVASPTTAPTSAPTGSSMMKDPWKAKQVKSANAALAAELQLLQQYKLREKQYAKQTNAATPFKYLELAPEDIEVLLKTPRSASSASSGSSTGVDAPHEMVKLDPTSWAKWHIEMSEKLKQRKAETASQLIKSQRVRMYNLDAKKPGTMPKKISGSPSTTAVLPSSQSGLLGKDKERRRESESEPSPSPSSTEALVPSPRVSGAGEAEPAGAALASRKSGRGLSFKM